MFVNVFLQVVRREEQYTVVMLMARTRKERIFCENKFVLRSLRICVTHCSLCRKHVCSIVACVSLRLLFSLSGVQNSHQ